MLLKSEQTTTDIAQARLARNSVTLGDYRRPLLISQFTKDVFAGFQIVRVPSLAKCWLVAKCF